MSDTDLREHLSGLFSDIVPEPEREAGEADFLSPLEESVVFGLFEEDPAPDVAERVAAQPPLPVWAEPERSGEEREIPRTSISSRKIALGKRSISFLSIFLYGVIILGGAPLLFLLIRSIGQGAAVRSEFSLYLALYTLAVAVTLAQWVFNSSLTKTLREVEGQRDAAIRSRTPLENRVNGLAAANASLQKRTLQLQTVAQISRAVASMLEQGALAQEAVNLIRDRFDLYHVGLFLIDQAGEWVVLLAGTGEAGAQMLAQGHRFEMNDDSVVGRCVVNARPHLALDTIAAQAWLLYEDDLAEPGEEDARLSDAVDTLEANALLPSARSEIVLPLLAGEQVIGVLDIQSVEREAFSEEDVPAFQMMADQLAAALNNARTFAEIRSRLAELDHSRAREQRTSLSPARVIPLYERAQPGVRPLGNVVLPEIERAAARREVVVQSAASDDGKISTLVAPVTLRDQVIGSLGLQELEGGRQWASDEIALIEAVADQMALAIENARLLEATQRRAEQEQTLSDMTARFTRSLDVDALMRAAVRELGRVLDVDEVSVHVGFAEEPA